MIDALDARYGKKLAVEEREIRSWPVYEGLSTRARHCLWYVGLREHEAIVGAFTSGRLEPKRFFALFGVRNYGRKTHNEIAAWLGFPLVVAQDKRLLDLCSRAADALEFWIAELAATETEYERKAIADKELIAELRKVTQ